LELTVGIHIKEVLPMLDTISKQQASISERLARLIEVFAHEPEPVEPILRTMLKPLKEDIHTLEQTVTVPPTASQGSSQITPI
jgi:hypothetical protein